MVTSTYRTHSMEHLNIPLTEDAAPPRTLSYMDVPHSLYNCNFSAETIIVNVLVQPYPRSLAKIFGYSAISPLLYSTPWLYRKDEQKISGCPSYYFCQNEILFSERVNGLLSKFFKNILQTFFLVFTVRQKIFHLATVKLCTSCSH
jgi:hypothetical protein